MKQTGNKIFAQFAKGKKKQDRKSDQKCVIYTRVSSADQVDNTSLQTQIDACREYAQMSEFEVVGEFGGTYESAKSDDDRKEFKRMLEFIKGRTVVTKIIVYSLDRFSRTGGQAISIIENLKKKGIDVHAVTQPADTDTATGKLMQQINLIFSNFDNTLRRQKTIGGMVARLKGGYFCGVAPHGYINTKKDGQKVIVPDGKRSKIIRQVFIWKAEEKITNEEIRKRIVARGWKISKQTLSQLIKNPLYCGLLVHGLLEGEVIQGRHKSLVSKEIFLAANEVNAKFIREGKNNPDRDEVALKRFLICEKCDKPLRGYLVKKKGIFYYKCCTVGCKVNRNAGKLHDLFLSELENFSLPEKYIAPVKDQFKTLVSGYFENQFTEVEQLKRELTKVETKIDSIETKYLFDEISRELYDKHHGKISAERAKIQAEIERTNKQVSNLDKFVDEAVQIASNLAVLWEKGDYTERQTLQKLVFPEGMYYDRENDKCRTPKVNGVFDLIGRIKQVFEQKNTGQSGLKPNLSGLVASVGIEPTS